MKTSLKLIAVMASFAILAGCASNGQPVLGSQAKDHAVLGTLAGILGGYAGAKALGANDNKARNAAILAGIAGGVVGHQHGKVLDERTAEMRNALATQQQMMIARDLQMQAQIHYENVAVAPQPTNQVPRPQPVIRPVARALELPIARYEVVAANGTLTPKAVRSLGYMSRTAQQANAELVVLVPSSDVRLAPALQGAAPGARLMESREIKNFVLIVQPRGA